ncbi:hypothetical protein GS426_16810 [Rhodococcus hoagii]|nr:hypothetical protein [Prescottella equi]
MLSRSRTALFGALAAGQGAGHLALTVSADGHLHQGVPVVAMLAAHAAATVVCAGLVLAPSACTGDHPCPPGRSGATRPGCRIRTVCAPRPLDRRAPRLTVLATGLSRRGPPLFA